MSIAAIFMNQVPTLGGDGLSPLIFDAVLSEMQYASARLSQYPLESGAIASDHAVQFPTMLTITVGVSDNPFKVLMAEASSAANVAGSTLIGGVTGIAASHLPASALAVIGLGMGASLASTYATRSTTTKNALHKLKATGALLNFVGTKETYKNVVIVGVRNVIDKRSELGGIFQIDLVQPLIISNTGTGSINVLLGSGTESTQGQSTANVGMQVPT